MSKRSAEDKISYYIKKIEGLRMRKKRRRIIFSSSDSDDSEDNGTYPSEVKNDTPPASTPPSDSSAQLIPSPDQQINETSDQLITDKLVQASETVSNDSAAAVIDPELLQALGESSDDVPIYGPDIHMTLAQRWLPILKKGILTEAKEKLMKAYLIPDNCKLLRAPTLNPEISAAIAEITRWRDKKLQTQQNQLGIGITAISKAMTLLLTSEDKPQVIKCLSDGCRILSDLHFIVTQVRSKYITPVLDRSILAVLHNESRDETLFGNNLADKIKASKAIEKQGQQIKKSQNQKASTSAASSYVRPRQQGNWSGPPRYNSASRGGRVSTYRTGQQYRRAPQAAPPFTNATPRLPAAATMTANKRVRQ